LPLAAEVGTGKPQLLALRVATGKIIAHYPLPQGQAPGNLIFHLGMLISQTATDLRAYPPLHPANGENGGNCCGAEGGGTEELASGDIAAGHGCAPLQRARLPDR
jgi:hypothetical protein